MRNPSGLQPGEDRGRYKNFFISVAIRCEDEMPAARRVALPHPLPMIIGAQFSSLTPNAIESGS
jgi:hypothetical protein